MAAKQVRISPENDAYYRSKAEKVGGSLQFQINAALDKIREIELMEAKSLD